MFLIILYNIINLVNGNFDEEMLWGTYKPQLLHGISQRNLTSYNPITVAMMYYSNLDTSDQLIYKVPQMDTENIKIKIKHHNGKDFNVQEINDPFRNCIITNTWVKFPLQSKLNWIDETSLTKLNKNISVLYAFTIEQFNPSIQENRLFEVKTMDHGILIKTGIEQFFVSITLNDTQLVGNDGKISILNLYQDYNKNWDPRELIHYQLKYKNLTFNQSNIIAIKVDVPTNQSFKIQIQQSNRYNFEFPFKGFEQLANSIAAVNKFRFRQAFNTNDTCAYESFTNLMQGLQFTYGNLDCTVQKSNCKEYKAMLTHTPSRLGFPRPFLWDEGFHNMIACRKNPDICLKSLEDWVNTMSQDGWIPREQPRNDELRSYIPGLKEDPRESNPPTFFFDFSYLLDQNYEIERIGKLYLKLKQWYVNWFDTQAIFDESGDFTGFLKWWGPNEESNLGSGLDDWPRVDGDKVSKYNIDAQAWGYFFCQQMAKLASKFEPSYQSELQVRMVLINQKAQSSMLDPKDNIYKDVLYKVNDGQKKESFSPHRGYPNLLPLALGMVDAFEVEVIQSYLSFMRNDSTIWTQYGLRSLEISDEYFGVGSNYWRGPIWINIQYLLLRGLKLYYWRVDGVQEFYKELRTNIIREVCGQYESRGYFYEHYNQDLNGKGKGNRPFNGWTSLITLIISEIY